MWSILLSFLARSFWYSLLINLFILVECMSILQQTAFVTFVSVHDFQMFNILVNVFKSTCSFVLLIVVHFIWFARYLLQCIDNIFIGRILLFLGILSCRNNCR